MRRGRNWRRAYDRDGRMIQPGRIGPMLAEGIRHVRAYCHEGACRHSGLVNVEAWYPETPVPDVGLWLVCSACGTRRKAMTTANWSEIRQPGMGYRMDPEPPATS